MKKKGFTLVELIGVILVMGIIALIVIPIITPVIFESKQGAFKSTVQNLISSAENNCSVEKINGQPLTYIYKLTEQGIFPNAVSLKGKLPTSGYIYVNGECVATAINLSDGESYINGTNETIDMKTEVTNISPFAEGTIKSYFSRIVIGDENINAASEYEPYLDDFGALLNFSFISEEMPIGVTNLIIVDSENNIVDVRLGFVSKDLDKASIERSMQQLSEKIDTDKASASVELQATLESFKPSSYYIDYEHGISIIYNATNFCEMMPASYCENVWDEMEQDSGTSLENLLEWGAIVVTNFAE